MARGGVVRAGLAIVLAARAAAATTAADLCSPTADPCVVTRDVRVAAASIIDVGGRSLVIARGTELDVGAGSVTILAHAMRVEPGAVVSARSTGAGGDVTIRLTGDLDVQVDGTVRGRIDVGGDAAAGTVSITADGDVRVAGLIDAQGHTTDADGGSVSIQAGGGVDIGGPIVASSGALGYGGDVTVVAGEALALLGTVDVSGGDVGGGAIDLDAGTTLMLGPILASGGGSTGDGGEVSLTANGDITLNGQFEGAAAGSTGNGGGTGADVTIVSLEGTVRVNAQMLGQGGTPDGSGGTLDVTGRDVILAAPIRFQGIGADSCGGLVSVAAERDAAVGAIDVGGGSCGGGSVDVIAHERVTVGGEIDADATASGMAGDIYLDGAQVTIGGVAVHADTGSRGLIAIVACDATVSAGGVVSAQGPSGSARFEAAGLLTVAGAVTTTANTVRYRSQPPVIAPGSMTPAPVLVVDPGLPVCQSSVCGDGVADPREQCDDGNLTNCDGCSATCRDETCGNGVVECGEQCDQGAANGSPSSGCDAACRAITVGGLLFVPAKPRAHLGCSLEIAVQNPDGAMAAGFPSATQTCFDGDPACDLDGVNDGACEFRVEACLHRIDPRLPECQLATITSLHLKRPSLISPVDAADQTNAQALVDALSTFSATLLADGTVVRSGPPEARIDVCTGPVQLRVPHAAGSKGRKRVHIQATDNRDRRGRNAVRLVCEHNPAVCGNGRVEVGEECDDGNLRSCDGCSATCRTQRCGDGVVQCAEECDAGSANGQHGSGCLADCTVAPPPLRIPGGGKGPAECLVEWAMEIEQVALDRRGHPDARQDCADNDPACDFDPTPGVCRLHVWACLGGEDARFACPAQALSGVQLVRPSERQPGALRTMVSSALGAAAPTGGASEQCTRRMDVELPASRRRTVVKTAAATALGTDRDTLKLRCNP